MQGKGNELEVVREVPLECRLSDATIDGLKKYRFGPEVDDGVPVISGE